MTFQMTCARRQESIKLHLDIRNHYYPTKLYVDDFFKQTLGPFKTGHLMPEVTRAHKVTAQVRNLC